VNVCWLYGPDEVILKAYDFLDSVQTGSQTNEEGKKAAVGALMLAVRRDLLSGKSTRGNRIQGQQN
jgi:hypothetical protein